MTEAPNKSKPVEVLEFIAKYATLVSPILILAAIGLYQTNRDWVWHELRDELGITEIRQELSDLRGDARILAELPELHHVTEPVHQGDILRANFWVGRTTLGRLCRFLGGAPIFTDSNGQQAAGARMSAKRQLPERIQRIRPNFRIPEHLAPGRTLLVLQLDYECDGQIITETTREVVFTLLPPRGG